MLIMNRLFFDFFLVTGPINWNLLHKGVILVGCLDLNKGLTWDLVIIRIILNILEVGLDDFG